MRRGEEVGNWANSEFGIRIFPPAPAGRKPQTPCRRSCHSERGSKATAYGCLALGERVRFDTLISARPSPHRAPRGYSRPTAAVTTRHQRVAVSQPSPSPAWHRPARSIRYADFSAPLSPMRSPREPPLTLFGTQGCREPRCDQPESVRSGTPAQRDLSRSGRVGGNVQRLTCNF